MNTDKRTKSDADLFESYKRVVDFPTHHELIQSAYTQSKKTQSTADSACETNRQSFSNRSEFKYTDSSSGLGTNSSRRDSNVPTVSIGSYLQKEQVKVKSVKSASSGQSKVSSNSYVSFDRAVK